jgi:hypothetical protein
MSHSDTQLRPRGEGVSIREYALLEEYSFVRREAQAEADLAYEAWLEHRCRETYSVYVAAQDRADAAQDDLADWARGLAAAC